jgi:hypothetical protein
MRAALKMIVGVFAVLVVVTLDAQQAEPRRRAR